MRGTSKVIMGATLVMVVSLAIVLGLILVLLAELYCSLLLRRRQLRNTTSDTPTATATNTSSSQPSQSKDESSTPPHSSFYSQGVLHAPRSLLFPAVSSIEDEGETKKLHCQLHHIVDVQTQESNASPRQIGLVSASSPPTPCNDKASGCGEHFVYISNPIYDNDAMASGVDRDSSTPFETPDTSPSRLEMGGSSGDDDEEVPQPSSPTTPPLTPMKKLPAEACSVSLRNTGSIGTSGSDSNSCNGPSSSSSSSPCTSPSW
ncbi:hypothetical protein FH972_003261 [Carpinus fangiana]|uniref:Uncharacterized protein n=1 Tax=Carpinus fangiana TaxID=176857 RepID=A0A5N6QKV3_9ROSI|nr:hypothetical protein FH972_003261 [Carpinus fangiana]